MGEEDLGAFTVMRPADVSDNGREIDGEDLQLHQLEDGRGGDGTIGGSEIGFGDVPVEGATSPMERGDSLEAMGMFT